MQMVKFWLWETPHILTPRDFPKYYKGKEAIIDEKRYEDGSSYF